VDSSKGFAWYFGFFWLGLVIAGLMACTPERDDAYSLNEGSGEASFRIYALQSDSNSFVIEDMTTSGFQRVWHTPGGIPATSVSQKDTILFTKKGRYKVSLHVSMSDGSGTRVRSEWIEVAKDAALTCDGKIALLTGGCQAGGKCWTLSREAGAVRVGPSYDDYSWFTSAQNGLQNTQYDDSFCFTFDGLLYENRNAGLSVNPWDGYKAVSYNPGVSSFTIQNGSGFNGRDQLIIPDNQFMGVWDADNVLDIVQLTSTKLVVRTRICSSSGVPNPEGWFELTFVNR